MIVYVWRQMDAEAVAGNLQYSGISGGIVVYHAGMSSTDRRNSQQKVSVRVSGLFPSDNCRLNLLVREPVHERQGSNLCCHSGVRAGIE